MTKSGVPDCQPLANFGARRQIGGFAFGRAVVGPLLNQADFLRAQTPRIVEFFFSFVGLPRRHRTVSGHARDEFRVLFHVLITLQRKRRDFAGTVASRAVLEDNRRDLFIKRHAAFWQGHVNRLIGG